MLRKWWRKVWRKMIVTALAGVAAGGMATEVFAENTDIQALLQRIERLEQQNLELQKQLSVPVATEAGNVDAKTVEGIVANYLKKQETERKRVEEAKKTEFVAVGSDLSFKASWKEGLQFTSPNGDFKVHVGGRAHYDWGWFETYGGSAAGLDDEEWRDAAGFRRGRLRVDGTAWEVINWVVEFDFANPDGVETLTDSGGDTLTIRSGHRATFTDVYMEITQLPWLGTFRAGHFKVPFGMEWLTSSRYLNTLERSLVFNAFVPQRRLGFMASNTLGEDDRATWAAGVFRADGGGNESFDRGDGEYLTAVRGTVLPYWSHGGRCLVHLGGAWVSIDHNGNEGDDPRYRSRMSIRLGSPTLIDTGVLSDISAVDLYGGEFGANFGPINVMAEFMAAQNESDLFTAGNPFYWGAYAQVSWFLTGEHRPYNKKGGYWDRVRPLEPFYLVRGGNDDHGRRILFGRGAVELVARYAYLDLTSDGRERFAGFGTKGVLQDMTLGLNWYFNPNFKWQINYVRAWRNLAAPPVDNGIAEGLAMRFAWDF